MKKSRIILAFGLVLGMTSALHAQATRTWVSGVGDDANPCSRTAPCKTFAGAISKTAPGGEIDALDPGGFGAVTITKAITINGEPFQAGVLASGSNGIVINATSNDVVVLRGLNINGNNVAGNLNGVRILQAKAVHIEHCIITEFGNRGVDISVTTANTKVVVSASWIRNNAGAAIASQPSGAGTVLLNVDDSVIAQNGNHGIDCFSSTQAHVFRTHFASNALAGFQSQLSNNNCSLTECVLANNGSGVIAGIGSAATVRISGCSIISNGTGINTSGGGSVIGFHNNVIEANGGGNTVTSSGNMQ